MMTIVIGCGDFALQGLEPDHPQRGEVEEMVKAANRAAEVTRQLLAYSRQQVFRITALNLNEIITALAPALARLIGSDRQLALRQSPGEVWVRADRGQLEQVLINLAANARDATGTDGVVTIDTSLVELDPEQLREHHAEELQPGQFARLTVRDNGVGMPPEVATRVFEPFFTTKAPGAGTGLGLSMVYGIVKQSGGFTEVVSTAGGGTVVAVCLPAVGEEAAVEQMAITGLRGAGEQILVVEDDPQVRAVTRRALQGAGYGVYEAITGLAALHFMNSHPGEIDLIVSDVVMPGVNGREMAEQVRIARPEMPVIFMSGYPGSEIERRGLDLQRTRFLPKPFSPDALIATVHDALARRPSPNPLS
jgi:CheY-like chemotaxis protein